MSNLILRAVGLALLAGCATAPKTPPAEAAHSEPKIDPAGAVKAFDHAPQPGEKAICPVSGDVFIVSASTQTKEYNGKYYAFCCDDCPSQFAANPGKYVQ